MVLGAIYGPSTSLDVPSYDIFKGFIEQVEELGQRMGTNNFIIAAEDFNLKLDQSATKPRACKLVQDFINQHQLIDSGAEYGAEATWRRPRRTASRLDYMCLGKNLTLKSFKLIWGKGDHAQILGSFRMGGGGGGSDMYTRTGHLQQRNFCMRPLL